MPLMYMLQITIKQDRPVRSDYRSFGITGGVGIIAGISGGMFINVGWDPVAGFSASLSGTCAWGPVGRASASVQLELMRTNAATVNGLNGTFYGVGKAGGAGLIGGGEAVWSPDGEVVGGAVYGGFGAKSDYISPLVTYAYESTTSSIIQIDSGVLSFGNTGTDAIWSYSLQPEANFDYETYGSFWMDWTSQGGNY